MTRAYAVVIRRARRSYSADCPDLPGCVAAGRTVDEALRLMRAAVRMHVRGLRGAGLRVPRPATRLATLARQRPDDQVFAFVRVAA